MKSNHFNTGYKHAVKAGGTTHGYKPGRRVPHSMSWVEYKDGYQAGMSYMRDLNKDRFLRKKNPASKKKVPARKKDPYKGPKYTGAGVFLNEAERKAARKRVLAKRREAAALKVNPAPLRYIITAQGTGKKMHYDGTKFSERARVTLFTTVDAANAKALELVKAYPVLRTYRIAIESNVHQSSRRPK